MKLSYVQAGFFLVSLYRYCGFSEFSAAICFGISLSYKNSQRHCQDSDTHALPPCLAVYASRVRLSTIIDYIFIIARPEKVDNAYFTYLFRKDYPPHKAFHNPLSHWAAVAHRVRVWHLFSNRLSPFPHRGRSRFPAGFPTPSGGLQPP